MSPATQAAAPPCTLYRGVHLVVYKNEKNGVSNFACACGVEILHADAWPNAAIYYVIEPSDEPIALGHAFAPPHAHEDIQESMRCGLCRAKQAARASMTPLNATIDEHVAIMRAYDRGWAAAYPRDVPSETAPDRFGNPYHSDRAQIEWLAWWYGYQHYEGTQAQHLAAAEREWMAS